MPSSAFVRTPSRHASVAPPNGGTHSAPGTLPFSACLSHATRHLMVFVASVPLCLLAACWHPCSSSLSCAQAGADTANARAASRARFMATSLTLGSHGRPSSVLGRGWGLRDASGRVLLHETG